MRRVNGVRSAVPKPCIHLHIGHSFFGAGNLGDDLVVAGFLQGLSNFIPLRISCATAYDLAAQRRRFPQIEWFQDDRATRERLIVECDAWIGLGGSLFQEVDDAWLLHDQLAQLELCERAYKPVFFISCSVDHRAKTSHPAFARLLDGTSWIWTRDAQSNAALLDMGFARASVAADLSHLALRDMQLAPIAPETTAFVCNFENADHYSIERLAQLTAVAGNVRWLVQEVRNFSGSELDLFARLPDSVHTMLDLRRPDYGCASVSDLLAIWGSSERMFTTRYHAAVIGAWSGSRVVVFERHQKLRGIAASLGLPSFAIMPGPDELDTAFQRSVPLSRSALNEAADQAQNACNALVEAVHQMAALRPGRPVVIRTRESMSEPLRIERLMPKQTSPVDPEQLGPGLKSGEIFLVRGCLQAIEALKPLRVMIFDTIEQVSGVDTRRAVEAHGLVRLHNYVSVDDLTRINPLLKQQARRLAPPIVARLAQLLPGLGADVHFEDTPNVRIFVPENVSAKHRETLSAYADRRGSGGELTLHPPHQDTRHFHPIGAINVWCAIDQVSEDNSMSVFPTFYGHHLPCEEKDGGVRADQYLGPPVAAALAAGDAWIFETLQMHGSTINQTDQTRVVISFRVVGQEPRYRDKRWYNYVRPADCSVDGAPPSTVDYSQGHPMRGRVTLNTSDLFPAVAATSRTTTGELAIENELVKEDSITPISDRMCVSRIDGRPVAFERRCPHAGYDLAGGAIRHGKIVCAWHGLRIDPATGASACETIRRLEIVACREEDGRVIVDDRSVADRVQPVGKEHRHAEAIGQFQRAANRFHTAFAAFREANGKWGLEELVAARDSGVYALLGLPGNLIRDRLEASVSQFADTVLRSGVRHTARTPEEETAFLECWRRLDEVWPEDAAFSYGLAALLLSGHAFELLALKPFGQNLGWTERLWLLCFIEILPANARLTDTVISKDSTSPAMGEVLNRLDAMTPAARDELLKTFDERWASSSSIASGHRDSVATHALQGQLETSTAFLSEANADRQVLRQNLETTAGYLAEANADREKVYKDIATTAAYLAEANADRERLRQNLEIMAQQLSKANSDVDAIRNNLTSRMAHRIKLATRLVGRRDRAK